MRLAERLLEMSRGIDLDLRELARGAYYIDQLEKKVSELTAEIDSYTVKDVPEEVMDVAYFDNLLKPVIPDDEERHEKAKAYAETEKK
jgi:hypothetical protein